MNFTAMGLMPGSDVIMSELIQKLQGVVLAGGRSRRFGSDKASHLLPSGEMVITHLIDLLKACGLQVVVSARFEQNWPNLEVEKLSDLKTDQGPLGGVEAVMQQSHALAYVFVTCDMPGIKPGLLRLLTDMLKGPVDVVVGSLNGIIQPFPMVIHSRVLGTLSGVIQSGERSVKKFLQHVRNLSCVDVTAYEFDYLNMNTLEDAARVNRDFQERYVS